VIPSLRGLAKALRRAPVTPTSAASLLERQEWLLAFRRIVREIFPEAEAEIWSARSNGGDRESARVCAFLQRVEAEFFPTYECDEYQQVVCGISPVRNAWGYERFHDLDLRPGELLLFTLCAYPYEDVGIRLPVLDAAEAQVPREALREVPPGGFTPAELRERLAGTPYAAAADFVEWLWGETGTVFLDVDDEVEIVDAEWTRAIVHDLAEQWQRAAAILERIGALAAWIESDPAVHFRRVLVAALGRDPHATYLNERRLHDCEITANGLDQILHDEATAAVSLPTSVAP
jgi:hypothetical protein